MLLTFRLTERGKQHEKYLVYHLGVYYLAYPDWCIVIRTS